MTETTRPSPLQQKSLIQESLEKESIIPDEKWYLISARWYKVWKEYVKFDDDSTSSVPPPQPIDNTDLIEHKKSRFKQKSEDEVKLRPDLLEEYDYYVFSKPVWSLFKQWYGGGPTISRGTIAVGEGAASKVIVEVYPLYLKCYKTTSTGQTDNNSEIEVSTSRKATVKQLKLSICKKYQVEEDSEKTRIWCKYDSTLSLLDDESKSLEDVTLNNDSKIMLEIQTPNGVWSKTNSTAGDNENKTSEITDKKTDTTAKTKPKKRSILGFLGFGGNSSSSNSNNNQEITTKEKDKGVTINMNAKPGICGLTNLGNTCFMNSALQCLSNTVQLTDYFLSGTYKNELNRTNPLGMKGRIAEEYGSLLKQMWSPSNANSCVVPRNFKLTIGKYAPQFSGYNQNDSQELLAFLLDGLHEDLNRITKKPFVEMKDHPNKSDDELAKIYWESHLKRDQSIIVDLFQGQLKSRIICPKCSHISITFDPFMYLSLPLPFERETTVDIILTRYTEPWELPYKYSIKVEKTGKIEELKAALSKVCGIDVNKLVLGDLYNNRIYSFLTDTKPISSIRTSDVTIAYEMYPSATPEYTQITMVHRRDKKKGESNGKSTSNSNNSNGVELFGIPFLMWIENKKTTGIQLYNLIWKRVKFFIKIEDDGQLNEKINQYDTLFNSNNESYDENIDKKLPFRIMYVGATGTTCSKCTKLFCTGCPVKFSGKAVKLKGNSPYSLSIDWDPKLYKKHFDTNSVVSIRVHASVDELKKQTTKTINITDCLKLFTTDEKLSANDEWYCPKCKEFHRAMKKFDLWKVPQILVVHLKRFQYTRWSREKIGSLVEFPIDGFDLSEYVLEKDTKQPVYDLFAVSHHSGGLGGGHYTSYAKNRYDNQWYLFNDSQCSSTSNLSHIQSSGSYVLFYTRRE